MRDLGGKTGQLCPKGREKGEEEIGVELLNLGGLAYKCCLQLRVENENTGRFVGSEKKTL